MKTEDLVTILLLKSKEIKIEHPECSSIMSMAANRLVELEDDLENMTAAADSLQQDVYSLLDNMQ